jgi:hypothetical protein
MAGISLVEPNQATPEVKEIYVQKLKGKPGDVQKTLDVAIACSTIPWDLSWKCRKKKSRPPIRTDHHG